MTSRRSLMHSCGYFRGGFIHVSVQTGMKEKQNTQRQGIIIRNLNRNLKVNPVRLRRFIKKTLQYKGKENAGLSLLLVNDRRIQELNLKYLRRPCPTDVLSFSSLEEGGLRIGNWLGDIVISTE